MQPLSFCVCLQNNYGKPFIKLKRPPFRLRPFHLLIILLGNNPIYQGSFIHSSIYHSVDVSWAPTQCIQRCLSQYNRKIPETNPLSDNTGTVRKLKYVIAKARCSHLKYIHGEFEAIWKRFCRVKWRKELYIKSKNS